MKRSGALYKAWHSLLSSVRYLLTTGMGKATMVVGLYTVYSGDYISQAII
jgi:hypothetical protein